MTNGLYLPIIVLLLAAVAFALTPLLLAWLWAKKFSAQTWAQQERRVRVRAPPPPPPDDEAVVIERTSEASEDQVAEVAAALADSADEHALFDISEFNIGGEISAATSAAASGAVAETSPPASSALEPHVEPVITAEAELAAAAAEAAFGGLNSTDPAPLALDYFEHGL